MPVSAWETVLNDPLVISRQAELAAATLLEQARSAAEHGDWSTVERLITEARQRFADQPWVIEVLESMAELARSMDTARFRKEALYSSRKMSSRISAKDEDISMLLAEESAAPSFLRRKTAQGKAQFDQPDDSQK